MKREDAIKLCRYYHGERECPLKEQDSIMFWEYERIWVDNTVSADLSFGDLLSDYLNAGLKDFEKFDDTPITLKALLFNRYEHWFYGDREGFKKWYKKKYI